MKKRYRYRYIGPSMTVHDSANKNTFYGVPQGLGYLAGGVSNAAPNKQTFTGTDPTTPEPAPGDSFTPTTPNPTPIDTPPNSPPQIDVGNTQMSPDELSALFLGFMNPGRTSRGRNPVSVIV